MRDAPPEVELTKWPRLLVGGDPVTPEQADEIILRTTQYFTANDRYWVQRVCELLGIEVGTSGMMPEWRSFDAWHKSIQGLRLHHLGNHQIMSSWIGGAHGWCHWDGTIGSSTYNIGKWPSVEAVREDLEQIAAAWRFLDLHCQLVPNEGDAAYAAAEWRVRGGRVLTPANPPPYAPMTSTVDAIGMHSIKALFVGGERGVELGRLAQAWGRIRPPEHAIEAAGREPT